MLSTSTSAAILRGVTEVAPAARPYHHGNLREELLERAEEVVRERGVADVSLRELAREIGVSHAAPRRHFPDRQALLDALALRGFERLGAVLEDAAAASGRGGFTGRLTRVATAYVRFATDEAALLELMFANKRCEVDGPIHAAADRAFAVVLALISEGQEAGELVPGDPTGPGTNLFAMLQGLASLSTGGMLDDDELERTVRDAIAALLTGLRPR